MTLKSLANSCNSLNGKLSKIDALPPDIQMCVKKVISRGIMCAIHEAFGQASTYLTQKKLIGLIDHGKALYMVFAPLYAPTYDKKRKDFIFDSTFALSGLEGISLEEFKERLQTLSNKKPSASSPQDWEKAEETFTKAIDKVTNLIEKNNNIFVPAFAKQCERLADIGKKFIRLKKEAAQGSTEALQQLDGPAIKEFYFFVKESAPVIIAQIEAIPSSQDARALIDRHIIQRPSGDLAKNVRDILKLITKSLEPKTRPAFSKKKAPTAAPKA